MWFLKQKIVVIAPPQPQIDLILDPDGPIYKMAMSRRYLLINLTIIVFNAALGLVLNLAFFNSSGPIRERYVILPEEGFINDVQVNAEDIITEDPPILQNETVETVGCHLPADTRRQTLDTSRGLLDKARLFKTHPFVITGENWQNKTSSWNVCLSTQASVNLLFWVAHQVQLWTGPMSVAVFVPDADYTVAIRMIKYLQTCFPEIRQRVTFHMTYPVKVPPNFIRSDESVVKEYNCLDPESVNKQLVAELRSPLLQEIIRMSRYPQNLMRNIAREGCQSDFTFTPDIDMIPIPGMSDELNNFLGQNSTQICEKCAFVIPTYEIHTRADHNPVDKDELVTFLKKRRAQRFHIRAFAPNQANSKLQEWEKQKKTQHLGIAYNITTWKNYWEPIYVTKANVPPFDERFLGYGFTRNSQVYEMHLAGYSWHMLNNGFLCHRGFQTSRKHSTVRRNQIKENSKRYKVFRKELYARYGKNEADYEKTSKDKKKGKKGGDTENPYEEEIKKEEERNKDLKGEVHNGEPNKSKNEVKEEPKKEVKEEQKSENKLSPDANKSESKKASPSKRRRKRSTKSKAKNKA